MIELKARQTWIRALVPCVFQCQSLKVAGLHFFLAVGEGMSQTKATSAAGNRRRAQGEPTRDLLLIAADLEERRLLLAELLEAGYQVLPLPGLAYAIRPLRLKLLTPPLMLVDIQGDQHATPRDVERLLAAAPGVPLILVVGAIDNAIWEPLRPRLAALMRRPISIGQIVDAVRARVCTPLAPQKDLTSRQA
jgi:hypothetical protein